jgi:hypothetical protein
MSHGWRLKAQSLILAIALSTVLALLTPGQNPQGERVYPFEGTWSAVGTRQALPMGNGRKAVIVYFSGSLVLADQEGLSRGFRSEVIGYDDGKGVSIGECVWTDEIGDQIFSQFKGQAVETGNHIRAIITGGTGRYVGVTGEYEFDWQYVVEGPDGTIQGRGVRLRGLARLPAVAPRPSAHDSP